MRYLRNCLAGLGMLLLAAAVLLWFLPARWAMAWIGPQLHGVHLQQVRGTLWDGRADAVLAPGGQALGQLQWRLSRKALLGDRQLQLRLHGPSLAFSGDMRGLADGKTEWNALSLRADLAPLAANLASPLGTPQGELRLSADRVLLQGGWPLQMTADVQWRQASMRTPRGDVALGDLQLQAQAQGGVIQARVGDEGQGPLRVDGQLQLSPLGWRLDVALQPRQTDPMLRQWLAGLGQPAADGSVHVQRHGGLALGLPSTH